MPGLVRYLVVEDAVADSKLLCALLAHVSPDALVDTASNLDQTIDKCTHTTYTVILLDLGLPDARGVEGPRRLVASLDSCPPILVLTGNEDEALAQELIRAGVQDYIPKREVQPTVLIRALRYAVERHDATQRLRAVINQCPNGMVVVGPERKIELCNDAARSLLSDAFEEVMAESFEPDKEHRIELRDGRWIAVLGRPLVCRGSDATLFTLRDVTEDRTKESLLLAQASTDPLTGCLNHAAMQRTISAFLSGSTSAGRPAVLAMVDFDHFKAINDSHGHLAGDRVLREIAQRFHRVLRRSDHIGRIGGDEFAFLLYDIDDLGAAEAVADKLVRTGQEPVEFNGRMLSISLSIGLIACAPGDTLADIVNRADKAMYATKRSGGNGFRWYESQTAA